MNIIIGIAGDSGVGKTTVSKIIEKCFGRDNVLQVKGDDLHKWPRGHKNWGAYTHLNPDANRLDFGVEQLKSLKSGAHVMRSFYNHSNGQFSRECSIEPRRFIVNDGLHSLYGDPILEVTDLKIYVEASEPLRRCWKMCRDMEERGHTRESVLEHCARREEDFHKYIAGQKDVADIVISFELSDPIDTDLPPPGYRVSACLSIHDVAMGECTDSCDMSEFAKEIGSVIRYKLECA